MLFIETRIAHTALQVVFDKMSNEPANVNPRCPFLGLNEDVHTSFAFPSNWNYCHRCSPIEVPRFNHQREFCLDEKYITCPVYIDQQNASSFADLYLPPNEANTVGNDSCKIIMGGLAVVSVVLILIWGVFANQRKLSVDVGNATPIIVVSESPVVSATLTSLPTEMDLPPTLIPTPILAISTETPISTRKPHTIYDLIGVNYIFRLYRVEQGLDLGGLASVSNTTVAAVLAVNYKLETPLIPGQLIIIPINQEDVSGLPQFEAYRVPEDISIDELAAELNADPELLRYYNGFGENEQQLMAKEWIIIPRERTNSQ